MKKKSLAKKIIIVNFISLAILLICTKAYANNIVDTIKQSEYTEEYINWTQLTAEEKEGLIEPRMYDVPKTTVEYSNPLKFTRMLESTVISEYCLTNYIPENLVVRNQQDTNTCWAFAALGMLESNLGLKRYYAGIAPIQYDFSERHMEYATSKTFLGNVINENGFNRELGSGGNDRIVIPYLTNGSGAINESEMLFENNQNQIDISEIQNKTITAYVQDAITFPAYDVKVDNIEEIKTQMKEHIKNYGGIMSSIHSATLMSDCYNEDTGAIYCSDSELCPINHSVLIIGWDDNYDKLNFNEEQRPKNNGAWIIKNSWGTDVGKEGIMYISYEDVNVYIQQMGIVKASDKIDYDNLYQYNQLGSSYVFEADETSTIYIANKFTKNTTKTEYITKVSLYASEPSTCKVYVNTNGSNIAITDLQQVELQTGSTETITAGYHTLEFLEPLEIKSNNFAVVVEMTGENKEKITFPLELSKTEPTSIYYGLKTETNKCFVSADLQDESSWIDTGSTFGADSTIKAFTVSEIQKDEEEQQSKENEIENSNFEEVAGNINKIKAYLYTDTTKPDYVVMDVILNNIRRSNINDGFEYYYYLSSNQKEEKIESWVKITEQQNSDSELTFKIDTRNISNYQEVSNANELYLYIKEIAIKDGEKKEETTDAIKLELNTQVEKYVDDKKAGEVTPNTQDEGDNTTASQPIPDAGNRMLIMLIVITTISIISVIFYKKYRNLDY